MIIEHWFADMLLRLGKHVTKNNDAEFEYIDGVLKHGIRIISRERIRTNLVHLECHTSILGGTGLWEKKNFVFTYSTITIPEDTTKLFYVYAVNNSPIQFHKDLQQ